MSVLVIAEHDNQQLNPATLALITAARKIDDEIHVLVAGYQCEKVAFVLQHIEGVTCVLLANHANYVHGLAESWVPLMLHVVDNSTHIIAPATTFGKNIMPRFAACLGVGQLSDVIEIVDKQTYKRPIYAGNAIATVRLHDRQQVITIRPTAFGNAGEGSQQAPVKKVDFVADNSLSKFISEEVNDLNRPELMSASIIIAGGRGLLNQAQFDRLIKIADKLGAAIGASRAAVDAGLAPNDWQVGQTGKVVAPALYFAIGISGAIQHIAGIKDSKVIVAINKDADAPIFNIADYGLVAEIDDVLSQWETIL